MQRAESVRSTYLFVAFPGAARLVSKGDSRPWRKRYFALLACTVLGVNRTIHTGSATYKHRSESPPAMPLRIPKRAGTGIVTNSRRPRRGCEVGGVLFSRLAAAQRRNR
jgi:hypothetical protein